MDSRCLLRAIVLPLVFLSGPAMGASPGPIRAIILAGDELVLEQAPIDGGTDGVTDAFYPNPKATADEEKKHVHCTVYAGAWSPSADYDTLEPVAAGLVELGEQRTRRIHPKRRGREPVPFTPFPGVAMLDGHTTVLRGWVEVPFEGHYEFRPGHGDSAFNVTTVNGTEAYRREPGQAAATVTPVKLQPGQRHAFRTIFFGKPGHAFRIPLLDKPGTLDTVVRNQPEWSFLKNPGGGWAMRDDVVLIDAHPIHNNTESAGHFLKVGDVAYGGREPRGMIGIEQALGHVLGDQFEEPLMLLRFGTHASSFRRGSRSLAHDYLPPSSGGVPVEDAKWDVIHFNWGVWDMAYRDPKPGDKWHSDKFNGKLTTPLDVFDRNLRELVRKMKATGATLVWGTITPMHEDLPGRFKEDPSRYNAVAEKIMKENGVRINDLHAESIRQGYPKKADVHSTGNLAPKAIEAIEAALAAHPNAGKPLPRVLLIGDSITGSYQGAVMKHFEGRANVYKNPGNAEHTGTGLKHIDEWLDPRTYLMSGQEYMELVNGVKKTLADMDRYYPGYRGQPVELAGMVWFQGIADASSARMAEEYGKHLPNLIRDLRKDLGLPELPVVVAALGWEGTYAGAVREAQLGISASIDHAAAIDTRPFLRSREVSPGGNASHYFGNAESYLDIGKAIGDAMFELSTGGR
ncbi:hypothetical protein MLD59_20120 [Verrucomicrobiaceae bacterium E54]|nr:hypothetical protein [Verrucomicrobiaceae bacterium E54]